MVGLAAVLAVGVVLLCAGLLFTLVALNRRQQRAGALTAGERTKVETLEQLYLHRKTVVDRSAKRELGPEAEAWSDMVEAKAKLGACCWPGCRNRDWAYSFARSTG